MADEKTKNPKADPKKVKVTQQWKADSPLICCRFDRQGKYIFAGGEDSAVYRWEVASGKRIKLAGHETWVRDFAFLHDDKTMVACDCAGRLLWWPLGDDEPKPLRTIEAHHGWARSVNVSTDGKLIATAGNDNLVKLWETGDTGGADTGKPVRELAGHERHVYSTMFHPDGKRLLSGDLMGVIHEWEIESGDKVRTFDGKDLHKYDPTFRADYGGVRSITLSPDGKHLACAGLHKCTNAFAGVNEPLVMRFDYESAKKVQSHEHGVRALAWRALFHPDGFIIAAVGGGAGGYLTFWTDDSKPIHALKLPNIARDMDLHPNAQQIATAHYDKHLRISTMAPG